MITLILFLIILTILLITIQNITKRKYSYQKSYDFFKQEENFDVLFFGSSHVVNGILPMELWNDYGIVSYNMGNHSEYIKLTYYNMLLALEETNPKLIIVDAFNVYEEKEMLTSASLHKTLDAYPLSYKKYLAIKNLSERNRELDYEMEYLLNFSMYHARWNELSEEDFKAINTCEKGAESKIYITSKNKINNFQYVKMYNKEENINIKYLRKIIEYCKENDIEILLTFLPCAAWDTSISMSKYVQTISNDYNIKYINFLNTNVIDSCIDFFDDYGHLNPSGARKVTDYIGQYIMENYDIPNQKENDDYSFWHDDYNKYVDYKIGNLAANEKNINNYLMLLYGEKDISYEIKISSKQEIKEGTILQRLLANIENNYEIDDSVFINTKDKTIKITTWDNRTGKEINTVWF